MYAQFLYRGTVKFLLEIVFTYIFNVWQRESEYEIIADELRTSHYRNNFCTPENEEVMIIIPIRRKAPAFRGSGHPAGTPANTAS